MTMCLRFFKVRSNSIFFYFGVGPAGAKGSRFVFLNVLDKLVSMTLVSLDKIIGKVTQVKSKLGIVNYEILNLR